MSATAKDFPQYVRDFLASPPHRGDGLNVWLFGAALRLHNYMSDAEIVNLLASLVAGEPLQHNEIERAVARSHGQDKGASGDRSAANVPMASTGSSEGPLAGEDSLQTTEAKSSIDSCSMAAVSSPGAVTYPSAGGD